MSKQRSVTALFVTLALLAALTNNQSVTALPYLDEIIPPLSRWDFLISSQQNLFVFSGTPEISDFWGEEE